MREMKDSGVPWVDIIPQNWEINSFRHCFALSKGLDIKKTDLVETGVPVLSYGQIHSKSNHGYILNQELIKFIPVDKIGSKDKGRINNGDFIFADTSEDLDGVGHFIHINCSFILYAGYHTLIAKSLNPNIYSPFFAFLFLTDAWKNQLRINADGIKVYSITQKMFKFVSVLIPPFDEQKEIAKYLMQKSNQIDSIIAKEQSVIDKLQEYKRSVITEAVTKGLNPDVSMKDSGVKWLNKIPKAWEVLPFFREFFFFKGIDIKKTDLQDSGVATVSYGQVHSKDNKGYFLQDSLLRFVSDEKIPSDGKGLLKTGDFVFADTSEDYAGIGNCIFINNEVPIYAGYHTLVARLRDDRYYNQYFAFLFLTDLWRSQLRRNATGTKVFSVTQKLFRFVSIIVPSYDEQVAIAHYLEHKCSAIDSIIVRKQLLITKLTEYKQSLIYEVVTGKKEVPRV